VSAAVGSLFLAVHAVLSAHTASLALFETVPSYIPGIMVRAKERERERERESERGGGEGRQRSIGGSANLKLNPRDLFDLDNDNDRNIEQYRRGNELYKKTFNFQSFKLLI
jgi:hypothetical protein